MAMFARYQPREDLDAALHDHVVVVPLAKTGGSHFEHFHPAPCAAVVPLQHFERYHSVSDGLNLALRIVAQSFVEKQRGAVPSLKELLQAQDLPSIAQ